VPDLDLDVRVHELAQVESATGRVVVSFIESLARRTLPGIARLAA
jgi:hypothetical protein